MKNEQAKPKPPNALNPDNRYGQHGRESLRDPLRFG